MKKEFCTYEQSLALKELGFDEECFGFYNQIGTLEFEDSITQWKTNIITLAPLIQQAFRFFREKYGFVTKQYSNFGFAAWRIPNPENEPLFKTGWFKTYEEAEQACLDKLIELAKEVRS